MLSPQISLDESILGKIGNLCMLLSGVFYVEAANWCGYIFEPSAIGAALSPKAAAYAVERADGLFYLEETGICEPLQYEMLCRWETARNLDDTLRQALCTRRETLRMRGFFHAPDYFGPCPPPAIGPGGRPVAETVTALDGVFFARVGTHWLLCVAYEGQRQEHRRLRKLDGVAVDGYYFFDLEAAPPAGRDAYALALGGVSLLDNAAPDQALMRRFPLYHRVLESWGNTALLRRAEE